MWRWIMPDKDDLAIELQNQGDFHRFYKHNNQDVEETIKHHDLQKNIKRIKNKV